MGPEAKDSLRQNSNHFPCKVKTQIRNLILRQGGVMQIIVNVPEHSLLAIRGEQIKLSHKLNAKQARDRFSELSIQIVIFYGLDYLIEQGGHYL